MNCLRFLASFLGFFRVYQTFLIIPKIGDVAEFLFVVIGVGIVRPENRSRIESFLAQLKANAFNAMDGEYWLLNMCPTRWRRLKTVPAG